MSAKTRRCGASLPDRDAEENQHYCYHPAGHTGMHEDESSLWLDDDLVEVTTVVEIRAVPHHEHHFVGGESCDGCTRKGPRATYQWRHPFTLLRS